MRARLLAHERERLRFPQPTSGAPIEVRAFHEPDFARLFRALP